MYVGRATTEPDNILKSTGAALPKLSRHMAVVLERYPERACQLHQNAINT